MRKKRYIVNKKQIDLFVWEITKQDFFVRKKSNCKEAYLKFTDIVDVTKNDKSEYLDRDKKKSLCSTLLDELLIDTFEDLIYNKNTIYPLNKKSIQIKVKETKRGPCVKFERTYKNLKKFYPAKIFLYGCHEMNRILRHGRRWSFPDCQT